MWKILALVTVVILWTHPSPAATLSLSSGAVSLEHQGNTAKAAQGATVAEGDTVITGSDGLAIVDLGDGSKLKISESSRLKLTALALKVRVELMSGSFFSKIRHRKNGESFNVGTQGVTMGVRGTEFFTAYGRDTKDGQDLWMCVHEGKVSVTDNATQSEKLVNQGEGVFVRDGKNITDPKPYRWTQGLNWSFDGSPEAVRNILNLDSAYTDLLSRDYD